MACLTLDVGRDTDVRVYRMNGNCDILPLPAAANFYQIINGAAAAPVAATTMTLAATPAGATIYANNYLNFVDPVGGTDSTVKFLTNQAPGTTATGANSVRGLADAAVGIDQLIPAGAIAEFPPRLKGRTSASVTQAGNTVGNLVFEEGLFMSKALTSIDTTVSLQGNFLESDAGTWTLYDAFVNRSNAVSTNLYIIITLLTQKSATFVRGSRWAFQLVVDNIEQTIETEGIKSFNISGTATGAARLDAPSR